MRLPTLRLYAGYRHTSPHLRDAVKELQSRLRRLRYRIVADGEFGPYTQYTVRLFQKSKGLTADGIVGSMTWGVLINATTTTTTTTTSSSPSQFSTPYSKWNSSLLKQLEELRRYETLVRKIADHIKLPASIIAGIGSRESHWGLALTPQGPSGTGDSGHGRGLMQIDDRWHPEFIGSGAWADAKENLIYGCNFLSKNITDFGRKTGLTSKSDIIKGGISSYNCGLGNALKGHNAGLGADYYTTGRDYAKNVLERAGWFQLHGW